MLAVQLSKNELANVRQLKSKETRVKVYRRLQALQMAAAGARHQDIATTLGVCDDTVTDWIRLYNDKGLKVLCAPRFTGKRRSPFHDHLEEIERDIEGKAIATLAELQEWIKAKYALEMEASWLWRCCKKNSVYLTKRPA